VKWRELRKLEKDKEIVIKLSIEEWRKYRVAVGLLKGLLKAEIYALNVMLEDLEDLLKKFIGSEKK